MVFLLILKEGIGLIGWNGGMVDFEKNEKK